jgi:hypothetical protein
MRATARRQDDRTPGGQMVNLLLWMLFTAILAYAFISSQAWPFAARLMPQVVSGIGLAVVAAAVVKELLNRRRVAAPVAKPPAGADESRNYAVKEPDPLDGLNNEELLKRSAMQVGWLVFLTILIYLIGILPATLIFVPAYMVIEGGMAPRRAVIVSVIYVAAMFALFDRLLHMPWPNALIGDVWPALRDIMGLRLL